MKAIILAIALCLAVASVQGYIGGYYHNRYYTRPYGNMYNNYYDDDYYMGGMGGYNSYRSPYYRSFGYNRMGGFYPGSYLGGRYNY
ncbi:uncharacterized protein LOC128170482 [Crassostrea angulata]|uniref:uncharacterized protein LOC128170482 n=1 Tax=Magallana angulata TaxID=2784310 RepID=UPI0022B12CD8|nr:uncharacterized protein LOC128170482 [Crassostrea angulata]